MANIKLTVFFLFLFHLELIDCNILPNSFSSYNHALIEIRKSNFKVHEIIDTSKSSWVQGLEYFSCDSKIGFLILKTKDQEYIHQGVPIDLWQKLKNANSFGGFYNSEVKGKYPLRLK